MPTKVHPDASRKITEYIRSMPPFSKAICETLRTVIRKANPAIVEDWKWGPNYYYDGMICGYGAFQKHVKFTFFNGSAMSDPKSLFNHCIDNEFSRSIKYTDVREVDAKTITQYILESIAVNQKGFKREVKNKSVEIPEDLNAALTKNKGALKFFAGLSYGYKKEYVEWMSSAKREATRIERIAKTVALCAEERRLNDKYR